LAERKRIYGGHGESAIASVLHRYSGAIDLLAFWLTAAGAWTDLSQRGEFAMSDDERKPAKPRDRRKLASLPDTYVPDFLEKLNRNLVLGRTLNQRYEQIVADRGGLESLTYIQLADIRSYVFLDAIIEHNEQQVAKGEPIDQGVHVQAINTRALLSGRIGVGRLTKPLRSFAEAAGWDTGKAA
jgi:hypothetical protein